MSGEFPPAPSSQTEVSQVTDFANSRPVALTIAGFDPSSGAGITADLKVFSAHNIYGVAAISAVTVQSTLGVRSVEPMSSTLVRRTLDFLVEDLYLSGIKIGMLGGSDVAGEVSSFLATQTGIVESRRIVLDPVICSSSGIPLIDAEGIEFLRRGLLAHAGWITPNLSELAILTGVRCTQKEDVPPAALKLRAMAGQLGNAGLSVVVTGGDFSRPDDFLLSASGDELWFPGEHIATEATHGTGCAFSSALLCRLIAGDSPANAVLKAKTYITEALRAAYPVGKGKGPVNHLFRLDRRR